MNMLNLISCLIILFGQFDLKFITFVSHTYAGVQHKMGWGTLGAGIYHTDLLSWSKVGASWPLDNCHPERSCYLDNKVKVKDKKPLSRLHASTLLRGSALCCIWGPQRMPDRLADTDIQVCQATLHSLPLPSQPLMSEAVALLHLMVRLGILRIVSQYCYSSCHWLSRQNPGTDFLLSYCPTSF